MNSCLYLKKLKPYCYQIGLLIIGLAKLLCVTVGIFRVTGTVWHVVTVPANGKHWIFQIPSDHGANNRVVLSGMLDLEPSSLHMESDEISFLKNAISTA